MSKNFKLQLRENEMVVNSGEMVIIYQANDGIVHVNEKAMASFDNLAWFKGEQKKTRLVAMRECNRMRATSRCGKKRFQGKCPLDKNSQAKCRCAHNQKVID